MNIRERVFLVVGIDFSQRKLAIDNIKKRTKSSELFTLTFHSKEINDKDLQQIFSFSFEKERIVIFKDAYNLPISVKDFLFKNLKKITSVNYIILEIEKDYYSLRKEKKIVSDSFFNFIFEKACVFKISSYSRSVSLNDFSKSIRKHDYSFAIYILEKLFQAGAKDKELGLQILGIIVGEISYLRNHPRREKSFYYLWEADRAIKEKGLNSRFAIEVLLSKLLVLSEQEGLKARL